MKNKFYEANLISESNRLSQNYLINFSKNFYFEDQIKRNGKKRTIYIPNPGLKVFQKKLLKFLTKKYPIHHRAFGIVNNDYKDNALQHLEQKEILKIDFKDFYNNINQEHLLSTFPMLLQYKEFIFYYVQRPDGTTINYLPTGSPLSPFISSLVLLPLDDKLNNLITKLGGTYSRYFDDIVISFPEYLSSDTKRAIFYSAMNIINQVKIPINLVKTSWINPQSDRVVITGVDVRNIPKVNKSFIREKVRPVLNYLSNDLRDIENVDKMTDKEIVSLSMSLDPQRAGILSYIQHINPAQFSEMVNYLKKRYTRARELKPDND